MGARQVPSIVVRERREVANTSLRSGQGRVDNLKVFQCARTMSQIPEMPYMARGHIRLRTEPYSGDGSPYQVPTSQKRLAPIIFVFSRHRSCFGVSASDCLPSKCPKTTILLRLNFVSHFSLSSLEKLHTTPRSGEPQTTFEMPP